jgi:hypothetical protein
VSVGLSAVRKTIKRLRPVIRKVRKRRQGSTDASCPWAKARLGWVTQLFMILGKHDFKHDEERNKHLGHTSTPDCFDRIKLPMLSIHQIASWYEVHKYQVDRVTGDVTYAFPCDNNGAFVEDGTIAEEATTLHMKYSEQGRFCCGVAAVMINDGEVEVEEGRRCLTYDYTGRSIVKIPV